MRNAIQLFVLSRTLKLLVFSPCWTVTVNSSVLVLSMGHLQSPSMTVSLVFPASSNGSTLAHFLFGNVERELPRLRAQIQDGDGEWFARAAKGAERVCRAGSFLWLEYFERATVSVGIATTASSAANNGSWCARGEARRARACGVPVPVRAVHLDAVGFCRWWPVQVRVHAPADVAHGEVVRGDEWVGDLASTGVSP